METMLKKTTPYSRQATPHPFFFSFFKAQG